MPENTTRNLNMLLVEEQALLRRTVALTARSLGLGTIHEAASMEAAERLLREHSFHGAVISIDCGSLPNCTYNLALLDRVRKGLYASDSGIPIAVMAQHATAELLNDLRERNVSRVILTPFRAKVLLDTFAEFDANHKPG
ncbi:response regulator [Duganella violaceipulchra]|uniref:CheY-like chemotaxis protein n=1 Tax=Duganella violaceipulchra TaxID=2849652 RepID=A0AA41KZ77_9BURK|nr:response regulator [Duganella violaceicalia]MBV6319811.1 response regulator [Duganella violaceicalia]MCP2006372.1 CheY-like chemotaxis protein [Duganella violaceicalia]